MTLDVPDPEALAPHVQVARIKVVLAARHARLVLRIHIHPSQAGQKIVVFATLVSSGGMLMPDANSHVRYVRVDILRLVTQLCSAHVAVVIMIVMQ